MLTLARCHRTYFHRLYCLKISTWWTWCRSSGQIALLGISNFIFKIKYKNYGCFDPINITIEMNVMINISHHRNSLYNPYQFRMKTNSDSSVLLFQPKYRLGHPENYLFLLSKKVFTGSKYAKNKLINFEKRNTAIHTSSLLQQTSCNP